LGRPVKDADLLSACQQSCPAGAIVSGDVNDKASLVAAGRASDLAYHVLEELNVRPNVTYLAKVKNPSPKLAAPREADAPKSGHPKSGHPKSGNHETGDHRVGDHG